MKTVEVKTADLIGPALDWAVGELEGEWAEEPYHLRGSEPRIWCNNHSYGYSPSTDWEQGGPLLRTYQIEFSINEDTGEVGASLLYWRTYGKSHRTRWSKGDTHLIAACRAIVAAKLGDVVSVPAELAHPTATI